MYFNNKIVSKMFVIFLIILAIIMSMSVNPASQNVHINKLVRGGYKSNRGDIPYIVSIRSFNQHYCGGSIINVEWILTAGHCFKTLDLKITIQYGVARLTKKGRYVIQAFRFIRHPDYIKTKLSISNDIALLQLKKRLKLSKTVQPVKLPKFNEDFPEGTEVLLAGWGRETHRGKKQKHLQIVNLFTYSDSECSTLNNNRTGKTMLCAGDHVNGKGQCSGDSGGPLLLQDLQIGVVSWSIKPCASKPGVFAKLSLFVEWIANKTLVMTAAQKSKLCRDVKQKLKAN